ncbi:long-chain acyl-CoA synthetase [Roseiarcus fermentans]|uniref:Long-chain-fatty-acid--CoA ligase n=1 Tax=Roseiarcus fermentans TaxID=1473586 RepID=A0A366FCE1_9HYPH|nr:long-chain fatty acid--CoA ligase [Roseiarcus fermentans]RBP12298.1 long-chain acyl-CoA synthetase [Roseiarcus fermentans]
MNAPPWVKSYPPGVRFDAPLEVSSVQEVLEAAAVRNGDRPALQFMDRRITYAELNQLADRAAAGFQKLGVGPGVHVGMLLPNTPHYVIAFFGVLKAGGTVVNYSPLDAVPALQFKVGDSETDILVTVDLAATYPQAETLLGTTRLKTLVIGDFAEFAAAPGAVRGVMSAQGMLAEVRPDARHVAFRDLLDTDGGYQKHAIADLADAVAVLAYTGGTTGTPKGAMLTHANLTVACSLYHEVMTRDERSGLREGEERFLCVLPLFHIYSLTVVMLLGFRMGAELVVHPRFDPAAAARDIGLKRITVYLGVPTMHTAILALPDVAKMDFSSLRLCASGGAPLPVALKERWDAIVGCPITEGWGMTETSPIGTFTPRDAPPRSGSCGIPYPATLMKLVDVTDPAREVPLGERGEICVKGPNVMKGYWKKPEATAAAMTPDGFFRTGDVATMDADGYVYIVDRTKDMLLVGGFNVYPRTIEEAIYQHPSVEEVSVIGVPDAYKGEIPKAFVKLKAGAPPLTLDDLKAFLRDRLGKHEMIGALAIRDALPKTAVGKISKKDLRDAERGSGGSGTDSA